MPTPIRILFVIFFALAPGQALSEPIEEVGAVFSKWKTAYDANDNIAVAKLYAEDATLHGTRSRTLTVGRDAITNYFKVIVGTGSKVQFVEQQFKVINPTAVLVAGFNDFLRNKDGTLTPEPARFTMLLIKQGDDWLIAHHHSSLKPPPPQ